MAETKPLPGRIIDRDMLPVDFPTHASNSAFWEELGRTIATFGFLEEMLGKAIFSLTGNKAVNPVSVADDFESWNRTLKRALTDQLGGLIDIYAKALTENERTKGYDHNELIVALRQAKDIRNVLCHGSWGTPDCDGAIIPKFVTKKLEVFQTPINHAFLHQTREATKQYVCDVLDSITSVGLQFPGSGSR